MILDLIGNLGPWSWILLSVLLFGAEILAPGSFLLWFGIAALVVGGLSFVLDWTWQSQILAFLVLSVTFALAAWRYMSRRQTTEDAPRLNERAQRHVGSEFRLAEPIVSGTGRVRIGDTMWRIGGADCPAGTMVKVTGTDGALLLVEKTGGDGES